MSMTLSDLNSFVQQLKDRIEVLERRTTPLIPSGPADRTSVLDAKEMEKVILALKEKFGVVEDAPPTDFTARVLADGSPVPEDGSHTEITASGQQKAYVVLSSDERAKGFVRPYRDAYRHLKCGKITTMGRALAETYAREPKFYSSTFCSSCRAHFPVGQDGEFTWYEMDGTEGPKVGT